MAKVKVYFAEGYVVQDDRMARTKRRATMPTIERLCLHPLKDTMEEVDPSEIDGDGFVKGAGPQAFIAANKRE
jgi:hypothetical protein